MAMTGGRSGAEVRQRHVFISFASADIELANQVVASLESAAIPCWIAHRDIDTAVSYPAAIKAAIASSAALVLVLTEAANRSPHVLREVEMAFNGRLPIVVLQLNGLLPSEDLQYFLSTKQWFDIGAAFDEADAVHLRRRLRAMAEGRQIADREGHGHGRIGRRGFITAILALSAAAVVALAVIVPFRSEQTRVADSGSTAIDETEPSLRTAAPPPPPPADPPPKTERVATPAARPRSKANPKDGQTYVWIPAGEFVMGCSAGDPACKDDERPTHVVRISKGFWLGRTEVTNAQYRKLRGSNGPAVTDDADFPVSEVTWSEAKAYCAAAGGRLPSEAEWEYAARAGTTTRYYGGLSAIAWYAGNSEDRAHPVARKQPNAFGLFDMLGNVSEWVRDRYYNRYDDSGDTQAIEEPLASNASALARGGSWYSDANSVRVSRRLAMDPDAAVPIIGFRCAHDQL